MFVNFHPPLWKPSSRPDESLRHRLDHLRSRIARSVSLDPPLGTGKAGIGPTRGLRLKPDRLAVRVERENSAQAFPPLIAEARSVVFHQTRFVARFNGRDKSV